MKSLLHICKITNYRLNMHFIYANKYAQLHICKITNYRLNMQLTNYYAEACNEWRGSHGRMIRTSAFGAVDSGLISSRVKPVVLKLFQNFDFAVRKNFFLSLTVLYF